MRRRKTPRSAESPSLRSERIGIDEDLGGLNVNSRRPFGVMMLVILELLSILLIVLVELNLFNLIQLDLQALDPVLKMERTTTLVIEVVRLPRLAVIQSVPDVQLFATIGFVVIFFRLVVTFGLWRLRRWAWALFMVQVGAIMVFDLWVYFGGAPPYLSMVTSVVMVFYLNQREVQLAFSRRDNQAEATVV